MIFAGLDSKEYIAKKGMANLEDSYKHILLIDNYLEKVYKEKKITGFEYRILKSVEDIYDEDLDIDAINEINQGIFPCIWINITYKPDVLSESDLMAIEKELLLVSL
jgi:hypothetical protein